MELTDPVRADLIGRREAALAAKDAASEPKQLDASNSREVALEAERKLASGENAEPRDPEPPRLREKPPRTVVERADLQEERTRRQGWKSANDFDELLDD